MTVSLMVSVRSAVRACSKRLSSISMSRLVMSTPPYIFDALSIYADGEPMAAVTAGIVSEASTEMMRPDVCCPTEDPDGADVEGCWWPERRGSRSVAGRNLRGCAVCSGVGLRRRQRSLEGSFLRHSYSLASPATNILLHPHRRDLRLGSIHRDASSRSTPRRRFQQ